VAVCIEHHASVSVQNLDAYDPSRRMRTRAVR